MPINYPPYVFGYGNIGKLLQEIQKASVPTKFTQDFISSVLGLKSTSYRAMIPLLKKLGFLDQSNIPTQAYKDYRDDTKSKIILAEQIRKGYADLYQANEYCHKLSKNELIAKLKTITGAGKDDNVLPAVAATFLELVKLADFDTTASPLQKNEIKPDDDSEENFKQPHLKSKINLGLSYTINLNLPATTEVEVFNAIFKSLKEHILHEK